MDGRPRLPILGRRDAGRGAFRRPAGAGRGTLASAPGKRDSCQYACRYDGPRRLRGGMGWRRFRTSSAPCARSRRRGSGGSATMFLAQLRGLTQSLIAARTGAAEEHTRFLAIAERGLCLPEAGLADLLQDATVLVTGGTGCVGSTLTAQLAARGPGRLVSVSRGITGKLPRHEGAEYRHADVRDRAAMDALIREITARCGIPPRRTA